MAGAVWSTHRAGPAVVSRQARECAPSDITLCPQHAARNAETTRLHLGVSPQSRRQAQQSPSGSCTRPQPGELAPVFTRHRAGVLLEIDRVQVFRRIVDTRAALSGWRWSSTGLGLLLATVLVVYAKPKQREPWNVIQNGLMAGCDQLVVCR
jgi:hypothetical protein